MSIQEKMASYRPAFKKLALSIGFIFASTAYAAYLETGGSAPVVTTPVPVSKSYKEASSALLQTLAEIAGSSTVPTLTPSAPTPMQMQTRTQKMQGPMMQKGLYADGSYTGSVADAYYGSVQVKAVIRGGKIADVQFLQYPNDRSNSRYINDQAMPLLTQEAIQAQSAQVSGVSGATFTSDAFVQSLTSALALAKN